MWHKTFRIEDKAVGEGCPVFIIAEAGVSHFGDLSKAFQLVDLAAAAGADAVKFQIFRTDELISSAAMEWKERMGEKELPPKDFTRIKAYCAEKKIIFLATAHDRSSLAFLDELGVGAYKIGSGEVKNWPFILEIAAKQKPAILSTGMYTIEDIRTAASLFETAGNKNLALLHCVTAYPTAPGQVNLNAIDTLGDLFQAVTGYSDHTKGFHFPLAAVAKGAKIIEKHITLDYDIPNAQDWKVSCGPDNLADMVRQIREIEAGLGTGVKAPGTGETESIKWARKSLVARRRIEPGEVLAPDMVFAKRPGTGIPPSKLDEITGRTVTRRIAADQLIMWEHIA